MAYIGKIKEFEPLTEAFKTYLKRLKLYFEINGIEDDKKTKIFLLMIGSKTYETLTNLVMPNKPEEVSFEEIEKTLTRYFEPEKLEIVERFQFFKRDQREDESVNDYAVELKKMASSCNFGSFLNEALRDRFICGLKDGKIQKEILVKNREFSEALQLAVNLELVDKQAKEMSQPKEIHFSRKLANRNKQELPKNSATKEDKGNESAVCKCCGNRHGGICKYRDFNCQKCGRKGHLRKICKRKNVQYVDDISEEEEYNEGQLEGEAEKLYFSDEKVYSTRNSFIVEIYIDFRKFKMDVDTGASVSLINNEHYERYFSKYKLCKCSTKLFTYGNNSLHVLGQIFVPVAYKHEKKQLSLLIVNQGSEACPMLLGRNWLRDLNIKFEIVNNLYNNDVNIVDSYLNRYSVFSKGNGKFKNHQVDITLEGNPTPIFCKARPVPYSLKTAVSAELDRLEEMNIIKKVTYSKWASPIVVVERGYGEKRKVRICGDYKVSVNQVARTEHYPLPNPNDIFASVQKGKVFTILDLKNAYQQLELSSCTQELLTVNTHQGLYQYKMMPYGITSAPAIFQATMDRLLFGIRNVHCYIDDILIWGDNFKECRNTVELILEKLSDAGLKIAHEKCQFFKKSVDYLGVTISESGIQPTIKGIEAIKSAPRPHNVSTLRSFLGLINFYGKFIPNLSTKLRPLHELLEKNKWWKWSKECESCFKNLKNDVIDCNVLTYYDPNKPLIMTCDASAYGVGAVLAHEIEGREKPICFASRSLNKSERQYSQLEKEALGIIFGLKRFHVFLYGRKFIINSDHQPLQTIFHPNKAIPTLAAARIQRWALILATHNYEIKYKKGQDIAHADALSRLPLPETEEESYAELHYFSNLAELPLSAVDIAKETIKDPVLAKASEYVINGWPEKNCDNNLSSYWGKRQEMSSEKNCLLWGRRIIIPRSLRSKILDLIHEAHPGIVRSKMLARSLVWWPSIDKDLENFITNCEICQMSGNSKSEPEVSWPRTSRIFERVHIDFAMKRHMNFLILIDAYSKWAEIKVMKSTTSNETIKELRTIFASFGIPEKLVSDNGPQFISEEFASFCTANGICHQKTPPYHPKSNGMAERTVQILKQSLRKLSIENNTDPIQMQIDNILFAYRNAPQTTTGKTPSEIFLRRKPRTRLSILKEELSIAVDIKKLINTYTCNDPIYIKTKKGEEEKWKKGRIIEKISSCTYLVESEGKREMVHVDDIKKRIFRSEDEYSKEIFDGPPAIPTPIVEDSTSTADSSSSTTPNLVISADNSNTPVVPNALLNQSDIPINKTNTSVVPNAFATQSGNEPNPILVTRRSQRTIRPPSRLNL